jgi:hypothetical protein
MAIYRSNMGPDDEDRPKPRNSDKKDADFEENYSDLDGGHKDDVITESDPDPDFLE